MFVVLSDNAYRLGPAGYGLGSALLEARRRLQSSDLLREGMRRLAERSGETVLLAVRDKQTATLTYVDLIESRNALRFTVAIGDRRPLYCTAGRSEEHTSELQSLMRISYAVFCLKKQKNTTHNIRKNT